MCVHEREKERKREREREREIGTLKPKLKKIIIFR